MNCDNGVRERLIALADQREEFVQDVDGFVYYWPDNHPWGHYRAGDLRILADELDARNAAWQDQIDNDPAVNQDHHVNLLGVRVYESCMEIDVAADNALLEVQDSLRELTNYLIAFRAWEWRE